MSVKEFKVLHMFSGIGGFALGFQWARRRLGNTDGNYRGIGAVDFDEGTVTDYANITQEPVMRADLHDLTPDELLDHTKGEHPDVVALSPPCKGFSGLLSNAVASTEKYQQMNQLVYKSMMLVLETFHRRPPKLIVLENVPKITTRGRELLHALYTLMWGYGYRFDAGSHDCGEIGGLAQHRKRFLLVMRHEESMPGFVVYKPPKRRVRAVGEVLGKLPLPDFGPAGLIHRLPRVMMKTWVRLALIRAGKDWRDLPTEGLFALVAMGEKEVARFSGRPGLMSNVAWGQPISAVTGSASVSGSNGTAAVCDPRIEPGRTPYNNVYRVVRWEEPSPAVAGAGGGLNCVSDPRIDYEPRPGAYGIADWDEPARTVTAQEGVGRSNGQSAVCDPRFTCKARNGIFGVLPWNEPAATVIGSADVHAGTAAVQDPRWGERDRPDPPPIIIAEDGTWHRPLTTLELAALQGFPIYAGGLFLRLSGRNQSKWRERIGNAVPPPAARAIAEAMLLPLLAQSMGMNLAPSGGDVWVEPIRGLHV